MSVLAVLTEGTHARAFQGSVDWSEPRGEQPQGCLGPPLGRLRNVASSWWFRVRALVVQVRAPWADENRCAAVHDLLSSWQIGRRLAQSLRRAVPSGFATL